MYKYLILHIPSGNFVSKALIDENKYMSWIPSTPKLKTVWGFDLPKEAEPIKFLSKSKAKLWCRQKLRGKENLEYTILEITE